MTTRATALQRMHALERLLKEARTNLAFEWVGRADGICVSCGELRKHAPKCLLGRIDAALRPLPFDAMRDPASGEPYHEPPEEDHHRCMHCGAYQDECRCDGGLSR